MTHLSIWNGKTHIDITDQFYYCHYYSFFSTTMSWYSAWSIIHYYSLITSCGTGNSSFFLFFQQYHNGKGGNTVPVGGAKMEWLGDKKRTKPGGREMREEDIISALTLASYTNSRLLILVGYKHGKSSTIRRRHLLTCIH
jgi:hypothetical protein